MIFESLFESLQKNELLLLDGGFCRFHIRKDGQLTIREIISYKKGTGKKMLEILKSKNPNSIFAKCPVKLESNAWYNKNGFILEQTEITPKGNKLNCWRLNLKKT